YKTHKKETNEKKKKKNNEKNKNKDDNNESDDNDENNDDNDSDDVSIPSDDVDIEKVDDPDDNNVEEAYTGNWKAIGTSQSEPHEVQYDKESQDWNEMEEAIKRSEEHTSELQSRFELVC